MLIAEGKKQGRYYTPDPHPEAGHFYRSDHFSFAKVGVPAISFGDGNDLVNGGIARGEALEQGICRQALPPAERRMVAELGLHRHGRGRPAAAQSSAATSPIRATGRTGARTANSARRAIDRQRPSAAHAPAPPRRDAAEEGRARMSETLEPALPDHLDEQAERLMHRLCDAELTVATAESCTGGMLAALLTDIEGAGHGFDRGFVTYTKEAKTDLLGIAPDMLDHNEAVSEAVARAMAEGALDAVQADIAIGVTGFAGPAGRRCEEGLVHFALARRGRTHVHRVEHFGAIGRGAVRVKSLKVMLEMLEQALGEA